MTAKRGASFSLDDALRDPGFTPRRGDVAALLDRVAESGDLAAPASTALLRLDAPIVASVVGHLLGEPRDPAPALLELLGRAMLRPIEPPDDVASGVVAAAGLLVGDRSAKEAALAIAKLLGDEAARARVADAAHGVVAVLVDVAAGPAAASLDGATARALARALTAAGTPAARAALGELSAQREDDKTIARAGLAAARDDVRGASAASELALDRAPPSPLRAVLACRAGLEPIVKEQLAASGRAARTTRVGRVDVELTEAPAFVLGAARSALGIAFPLEAVPLADTSPTAVGDAVAGALFADASVRVLAAFDRAPFRFRVSFAGGGKQRAVAWAIADRVAAVTRGALVNDPREAPWEVAIALPPRDEGAAARRGDRAPFAQIELRPRFADRRFPWRRADVPAASHPTIAAAIALVGGARRGDVVWDPFVGSGGELCERARLGDARRYIGTDVSEDALRAAKLNTEAAKIAAELVLSDARAYDPGEPVDLILSNPPMGRRVLRHRGDVDTLLQSFLGRASRLLAKEGRLAWVSAHPRSTREAAAAAGLRLIDAWTIDLGGFDVELQRFEKL